MVDQLTAARRITMYDAQWQVVEDVARDLAEQTGGRPNISAAMRVITKRYHELMANKQEQDGE